MSEQEEAAVTTQTHGPGADDTALLHLLRMSQAGYEELLAVPADYALQRLAATSVSLSRWERDRGHLRCVVNAGRLAPGEERFPADEVFDLTRYAGLLDAAVAYERDDPLLDEIGAELLARHGHRAALCVPVHLDGRVWGVVWATKDDEALAPGALAQAVRAAEAIAPMIAMAERIQTVARLAFSDPLTGLGNRRLLDDTLADLLRPGGPGCTVVACDVDGLKQVNDELGHAAGDRVIVAVSDALAAVAAGIAGAVAVRLGGDEFALVLPGAARTAAIQAVEAVDARLAPQSVRVSCGIAAVPDRTSARDVLSVADAAQYAAKRRGALLVVASDLGSSSGTTPRRRVSDRPSAPLPSMDVDVRLAVAAAVRTIAAGLAQAPGPAHERLEWLGERLLGPFDLDHWSVSSVDLGATPRQLTVSSMGMRVGRPHEEKGTDLLTDHVFDLADYPVSERAILERRWFCFDALDPATEAAELSVLTAMGKRYVLGVGCAEGSRGSLLELYGRADQLDLALLGSTLGLAASAVLGQVVSPTRCPDDRMGP